MKILFVAEHEGPFQTLNALARKAPQWVNAVFALGKTLSGKYKDIPLVSPDFVPDAVILGTSETFDAPNIEEEYGITATKQGIPVFSIEDFPLNFRPNPQIRIKGLFVEFAGSRHRYVSRGIHESQLYEFGNPRYADLPKFQSLPKSQQLKTHKAVLWAGQPDDGISFQTLRKLLPFLSKEKIGVYFRAHPRDGFYSSGAYHEELTKSGVIFSDVTLESSGGAALLSSDLLLTQFSTMAMEAFYRGIPSVFVLFPELGARFLRKIKGEIWLPWVEKGMAFQLTKDSEIESILIRAINDENARRSAINNAHHAYEYNIESPLKIWGKVDYLVKNHRI